MSLCWSAACCSMGLLFCMTPVLTKMVQLLQADDVGICFPHLLQYQRQPVLPLQATDGDLQWWSAGGRQPCWGEEGVAWLGKQLQQHNANKLVALTLTKSPLWARPSACTHAAEQALVHYVSGSTSVSAGVSSTPRMRTISTVWSFVAVAPFLQPKAVPLRPAGVCHHYTKNTHEHIECADPEGVLAGATAGLLQGDLSPGQFLVHRTGLLALHQQSGQEPPESSCPAAAARQMRGACCSRAAPTDPGPAGQHALLHEESRADTGGPGHTHFIVVGSKLWLAFVPAWVFGTGSRY
jgi:hypothetical protein